MKIFKPPTIPDVSEAELTIFLAGSIEQGKADNWQDQITKELETEEVVIFNPRRVNWNSKLKQDITNPEFAEQVNWELDRLNECDIIFMYIDPKTQSPITLLEFGQYYQSGKLIICCPDGFWRKGNLQVCCERAQIHLHDDLSTAISALKTICKLRQKYRYGSKRSTNE